jgi:hypothetical protein
MQVRKLHTGEVGVEPDHNINSGGKPIRGDFARMLRVSGGGRPFDLELA